MASKKVKKDENNKKYSTFQLSFIILLTGLLFALCGIFLIKEISTFVEQKKYMDDFYDVYESEELSIIYYSAEGCGFCEMQKPILDQIAKDYDLEYLNVVKTKLTESQNKEIMEKLGIEGGTPATIVVRDSEVIAVQSGYVQGNRYVDFFKKAGVLEEDAVYTPDKNLTFIKYAEFQELQSSKEPVVVVIGQATCENCTLARPILSNLANAYNIPIYYITLDYISSEDRINLVTDLENMEFSDESFVKDGKLGTPTTLIIKDNKIVNHIVGLSNIPGYTELFKETGVVKE